MEWTGKRDSHGYGRRRYQGRQAVLAHRIAFFETHGYWPNVCRHTCDNPPCVNPDHLLDGTPADNSRDMVERGRALDGTRAPWAKLVEADIPDLVIWFNLGYGQRDIAKAYGVSQQAISMAISGKTWKNVSRDDLKVQDGAGVRAKLTPAAVRDIRRLCATDMTRKHAARQFGVSICSVDNIVNGKTWKDVK